MASKKRCICARLNHSLANYREVAVKKMKLTSANMKDITTEIKIMKASVHPNIINYINSYIVDDKLWVVMEYMV